MLRVTLLVCNRSKVLQFREIKENDLLKQRGSKIRLTIVVECPQPILFEHTTIEHVKECLTATSSSFFDFHILVNK